MLSEKLLRFADLQMGCPSWLPSAADSQMYLQIQGLNLPKYLFWFSYKLCQVPLFVMFWKKRYYRKSMFYVPYNMKLILNLKLKHPRMKVLTEATHAG